MSDPVLSGFAGQTTGASDLASEEPHWVIVQGTTNRAHLGQRIIRDEHYTVDANDPDIREALARGYFTPLPASQQPEITTDPVTKQPTTKEKTMGALTVVSQRKVVAVSYDKTSVKGHDISVQAAGEEKRDLPNTGTFDLFFANDFTGDSGQVTVDGSDGGSITGTVPVQ